MAVKNAAKKHMRVVHKSICERESEQGKPVQVVPVVQCDIAECDKWIRVHTSINLRVALSHCCFIWPGYKVTTC